ncbi:MAG TPA: hypothetical protein DEA44_16875 [Firmicutes bacterium]|nr:hypothetical protein [Bacillota bacterium]
MVVRSEIWATAAAIAANVASCSVFDAVYPSSPSKSRASLAWKIILLVFTVVYAILYIVYGHTQFLPYSGTSIFILIGLIIYSRKEDKNVDAPSK